MLHELMNVSSYVMKCSSLGDNHSQEDIWAKSVWRETRVLGYLGLVLLHRLLPWHITSLYIERIPDYLWKAQSKHNKIISNPICHSSNLIHPYN